MPTTETRTPLASQGWPPLTPTELLRVSKRIAWTALAVAAVLALEMAGLAMWLREASREDTEAMIRACVRSHAAPQKEDSDGK